MALYFHPRMRVLRVAPDAAAFLKAYTTHLLTAPSAAFLSREGRTIAVVRQLQVSDSEALLIIEKTAAEKLLEHLSKYLAISETKVLPADEWHVYFDLSGDYSMAGDKILPDRAGRWIVSLDPSKSALATTEEYTRFRVQNGLAEQGVDFTDEIPLCVDEALVHFDKGCYLGQEIVARIHYRGKPPKKLIVKKQSDCSPEEMARMTSKVLIQGEPTGFVFVST